ncbi:TIGR04552 family protein [Massilia sp. B-10]|nr:TIGR04552 family protein [Massilia sp. B-10]
MWSCALLKVMHGIFYIDSDLKLRHFNAIREQVFASLDEVILKDGEQYFLTDGEVCLPLLHYDKKSHKGRNSILLKLLQKAAYLAADIYDHLGVRMVFMTRFECLLALHALQRAPAVGDQCRPPAHPQHPARPGRGQASLRQVPQPDRPLATAIRPSCSKRWTTN